MTIDGTWEVSIKAIALPITLKGTFVFKAEGKSLSGTSTTDFGTSSFADGKVDGNNVEFSFDSSTPFGPATLEIDATIENDDLTGKATMLPNGMKATLTGTRVT